MMNNQEDLREITPVNADNEPINLNVMRVILIILFLGSVAVYILNSLTDSNPWGTISIAIIASAMLSLTGLAFLQFNIRTPVQYGIPIVLDFLVTLVAFQSNGEGSHGAAIIVYPIIILLASLLLGKRGVFISTILVILSYGSIINAELNGSLQNPVLVNTNTTDGPIVAVLFIALGSITYTLIDRLYKSVEISRNNERAQADLNFELKTLQNELSSRINQRTRQLTATIEVTKAITEIRSTNELISKVVNLITDQFGYYYAAIFLLVDNGRWAELADATGTAGQTLKARKHRLQTGGNSMVSTAIASRQAQIVLDTDIDVAVERFNNPLLPNTRSEIALPLMVAGEVIGALDVQSKHGDDFRPEDVETLQSMANQVAIAISNAQLFEQMNSTLEELSQLNKNYIISGWTGRTKSQNLEATVRQPIVGSTENLNELKIPMTLRDENIGQIFLETDQDWSNEDQAWVEALATQVAFSLENARLVEDSQQSALRERISASIVQKLWSSNSVDSILQTVVRELGRALDASEATIELKMDNKKG